jgi:hypothetical protein
MREPLGRSTCCVAALALVSVALLGQSGTPCGWLVTAPCCQSITGSCGCLPTGEECQCTTDTWKNCHQGTWTFSADPNGPLLELGPQANCYTLHTCNIGADPGGSSACGAGSNCAADPQCSWRAFPPVKRAPWKYSGLTCVNGGVPGGG